MALASLDVNSSEFAVNTVEEVLTYSGCVCSSQSAQSLREEMLANDRETMSPDNCPLYPFMLALAHA